MREIFYWQALNEALREEMKNDERVFLMGEDIGAYGGAYGVTRGLYQDYGPERVRDTAISESAIAGAAIGASLTGMRPVAEIMYIDFITQAMDQLVNQAAKMRYMFGGKTTVPLVLRTQGGTGRGIATHHSQSLESWFMHVPGLYLAMPSTPYDAKGLLKTAIRDDNPIIFVEHKMLYGTKGAVPPEEYTIPLGKAEVKRKGNDLTIVAYSRMVLVVLEVAQELAKEGIDIEVIDPRTLKPLDIETIINSVKKTGRFIAVHEACKTGGVGGEIMAQVIEEAFDYLDVPPVRIAGVDVPIPMSPILEKAAVPNKEKIIEVVKEVMG